MKSLILTLDNELRVIQYNPLLKYNSHNNEIIGVTIDTLASQHAEFKTIYDSVLSLRDKNISETTFNSSFTYFYHGLATDYVEKNFQDEEIVFVISKSAIGQMQYYFVFANYTESMKTYISLMEEKEKVSFASINILREISKTVLNEPSAKIAAKKSLELVCDLFKANTAIFRIFHRNYAEIYATHSIPYGYTGRNAQVDIANIPMYKEVSEKKTVIISENPSEEMGRLYAEMEEFTHIEMMVVVPIIKKEAVIATLSMTFDKPYRSVLHCIDILENVVNEFDFLIERNEYYFEILNSTEKLRKLSLDIVTSLSDAIETRDSYTNGHSKRVAIYSVEIARNMGWDDYEIERLSIAGILHDIGKVGIPDAVLLKPTPLNKYEYEIMKLHPEISANIVSKIENFQDLVPWVRYHHEFYDGSGYPFGLKGNEIPIAARIIAVADAFDAMSSDRPYRKALPMERVEEIMNEGSGTQWDKEIIRIAMDCLEVLPKEIQSGYNIPEKLDEFRKMIFNISLLSGLYLYEFIFDEVEKYIEQHRIFSLGIISLKSEISGMNSINKKRIMNSLIELGKSELHYPIMLSRFNYYQLIVFAPLINKKFLRSILTRLQIKFFEKNDIFFSTNIVNFPDDADALNQIFDILLKHGDEKPKPNM